jgi:hypothetical protein
MQVTFDYSKEKDVWCLLNKGKSSNNNPYPTKVYELLVSRFGNDPNDREVSSFIDEYLEEHEVVIEEYKVKYQNDWALIADDFHKRAERIFGIQLQNDITVYLTINNRNPYNIEENMFYVTVPSESVRKTIMHELWHFYTWYGMGIDQEEKLGKDVYNNMKEALTVLLNIECADLFPPGVFDVGYPQHQDLRQRILDIWHIDNDIKNLWKEIKK